MLFKLDKDKVYYLASPYSHRNAHVQEIRYQQVSYAAALLNAEGYRLIEPIGMCHGQSLRYKLPTGYEYWQSRDRELIARSDGIIILDLPGWSSSVGVQDEIKYAAKLEKDIVHVHPCNIFPEEVCEFYGFKKTEIMR